MPKLADLLYNDLLNGCAISVFRRVHINPLTIEKLLDLNKKKSASLIIQALSHVDNELWSDKIEREIIRSLKYDGDIKSSAALALYNRFRSINLVDTLTALKEVTNSKDKKVANYAIWTLCYHTKLLHHDMAKQILQEILTNSAQKNLSKEIAEALGWATDCGLELLKISAKDEDPEVRLATIESIARTYINKDGATLILLELEKDIDENVSMVAKEALKQNK